MEPAEIGIRDLAALSVPSSAYVGNDVCRLCHEAAYQKWLETSHARAAVMMRSNVAVSIGQQQGVTACCPAHSGKCLGCHGTAHDVAAEGRGPGFRIGEGVACEKCHGPGADHVLAMEGKPAGPAAALAVPGRESCRACHPAPAWHAPLGLPVRDPERAWASIAHPLSSERPEDELEPAQLGIWRLAAVRVPPGAYAGSQACAPCHQEAHAVWAASAHARASAALRSEEAVTMGMKADRNAVGGPSKTAACLTCHATAHDVVASGRGPGFRMREGVGCEQCHGPAADHVRAMEGGGAAVAGAGLHPEAGAGSCLTCHRPMKSHEALGRTAFDQAARWERIAH